MTAIFLAALQHSKHHLRHSSLLALCFVILLSLSWKSFAFSPYSNDELDQLEKEFVQQINQADSVIRTPLACQYINHLAQILAVHGQLKLPYFFLVRSNEINAFAGPGGYIGVNSQLILATANEHELAAVMAHEMAHVRLHHLYRLIERQKQMRVPMLASLLASIALGVVNPTLGSGAIMAAMTGFAQDNINFVRSNEKEADRIGIDMLIKSGLDPHGMANFFQKMQQNTRYYSDNIPAILRSHPLDEERIAEAENRVTSLHNKTYPDHLDYHLFKELIRNSIDADPQQLLAYYQKGQCLKNNQKLPCEYGYALALLAASQYPKAQLVLAPLAQEAPDNLFYAIALSQAAMGMHQYDLALHQLRTLMQNFPGNYALIMELGQDLMDANHPTEAAGVLLKGSRDFNKDLPLCLLLARAQALNKRKDYAYFTEANCHLLQGQRRAAMQQLKLAKSLNTKDRFLAARIAARMDEIKMAGGNQ